MRSRASVPARSVVESGSPKGRIAPGRARSASSKDPPSGSFSISTRPTPTWLFVLRAYWPYRSVELDGRPVEAVPAQLAFSAVPVPAGPHRLVWDERVPGLAASVWGPVLFRDRRGGAPRGRIAAEEFVSLSRALRRTALALLIAARPASEKPSISAREAADQTRPAEEWLREEPVRLLRDYVRIDTSPEQGASAPGAEFLSGLLRLRGDRERKSSVRRRSAATCSRACRAAPAKERCCSSITSTSSTLTRSSGRRRTPFEGKIKNGYLYGRGAYDMKSIGLAQALAMRSL